MKDPIRIDGSANALGSRMISNLPSLSEFLPGVESAGFPESFAGLFEPTEARLLRSTLPHGGIVAFRNKDLLELAASPAVGNMPVEYHCFKRFFRNQVFTTNPPLHEPMRQVIARPLTPRNIPALRQIAKRVAATLLDEVISRGEIDFCTEFSERFTTRFWGALFEMTEDEVAFLASSARTIAQAFVLGRTEEEAAAVGAAMDEYLENVACAINRALQRGNNELLSSMADAFDAIGERGKPDQVGEMIAANVFEGVHTVAAAGANVLRQLLLCPEALAAVRADSSLIPNAVAEGLRLWAPLIYTERYALQDLEFAGTRIPHCTTIVMLWAAGDRDPELFEHPNRYDLFRKQRRNTTFGGGIHICPGRYVARMLVHAMLEYVLAPDIRIELIGDPPAWIARCGARQLDRMRVTLKRW